MPAQSLSFTPNFQVIQGALLQGTGGDNLTAWATFNNIAGGLLISQYTIYIYADYQNFIINYDNSMDFDFTGIKAYRIVQTYKGNPYDFATHVTLVNKTSGVTILDRPTNFNETFDTGIVAVSVPSALQHIHIPQGSTVLFSSPQIEWTYVGNTQPNSDIVDMNFKGAANTLPTYYTPLSRTKLSFNSNGYKLFHGSVDISQHYLNTQNVEGDGYLRHANKQMPNQSDGQ